ncbi:hypothetical protein E4U17_006543, partial [Claviceps sp. LM77 group G4]
MVELQGSQNETSRRHLTMSTALRLLHLCPLSTAAPPPTVNVQEDGHQVRFEVDLPTSNKRDIKKKSELFEKIKNCIFTFGTNPLPPGVTPQQTEIAEGDIASKEPKEMDEISSR